ncbi:MAG: hypothetical protein WAW61_22335 [Methylococcaceae bacterium]
MYILLNKDQKSRPQWKQGRIRKAIGGALFIALASAAILSGWQVKSAAAEINRVSQVDYLISPDMAEYMIKYGHGEDISEMDSGS